MRSQEPQIVEVARLVASPVLGTRGTVRKFTYHSALQQHVLSSSPIRQRSPRGALPATRAPAKTLADDLSLPGRRLLASKKFLAAICPIICGRLDLARRATRMATKRHLECSAAVNRRLDPCNRERISDCSPLGFEGGSHLLENKTLAARDKNTSNCISTLCEIPAYASWPEALSPIGGAESRCPLLSAIRALRRGKFHQGVCSVKDGVKRVCYWLLSAGGEQQRPHEEARCSN
jgi:hypothetical protein